MENNRFTFELIPKFDIENANGRIYTKECFESAVNSYLKNNPHDSRRIGTLGFGDSVDIDITKVSHILEDISVSDNNAIATIKLLDTPAGNEVLKMVLDNNVVLRASGTGRINPNTKIVEEYSLISTVFVPKDEDAWA